MPYNKGTSASEPLSAEKLTEELNKCVELQETMKAVNAYWRKTGTCVGAPGITEAQAKKIDEKNCHDPLFMGKAALFQL